ncbi:MAG TPA: OmpA family protein [Gammaproteobacteria bacterium]|nr:OmpA family protein [Gammaproteobacteria bacterium]
MGDKSIEAVESEPPAIQRVLVAPSTDKQQNVLRGEIRPVACWRVDDHGFDFGSSFTTPALKPDLERLARMVADHPKSPLSIFGHADPTGDEDFNKTLSGRRAAAIYALLTRNVGIWEELHAHPFGEDRWSPRAVEGMRRVLGEAAGTDRARLFRAYMDWMCGGLHLEKSDFLAGGADSGGHGDWQGCGEFNPALLLASSDANLTDAERNLANAPNRRVVVLLFRPGTRIDPGRWPCPRAKEGPAQCRKRFWSDAEARLARGAERRRYRETHDTFACRFYDRLVAGTDCEDGRKRHAASEYFVFIPPALRAKAVLEVRKPGVEAAVLTVPAESAPVDGSGYCTFDLAKVDPDEGYLLELVIGKRRVSLGVLASLRSMSSFQAAPGEDDARAMAASALRGAASTAEAKA